MIDRLKAWLTEGDRQASDGADEVRLAVAALLVEAAQLDDHFDAVERAAVRRILQQHFQLDEAAADALARAGEQRAERSVQLFGATRLINQRFSHARRLELVEMMWEVTYADGVLDPLEDAMLRRVAGLVDVSDHERGEARRRVQRRLGLDAAG
ncbi:MAG: TerB family tellurite resistance protein [Stellaceae bacterium]